MHLQVSAIFFTKYDFFSIFGCLQVVLVILLRAKKFSQRNSLVFGTCKKCDNEYRMDFR